jgi:hypothetical protein
VQDFPPPLAFIEQFLVKHKQYPWYLVPDQAQWLYENWCAELPELRKWTFPELYHYWANK